MTTRTWKSIKDKYLSRKTDQPTSEPSDLAKQIAEAVRRTHQYSYEETISTSGLAELEAERDRLRAVHEAELGVCEQHCDVVADLEARLAAAERRVDRSAGETAIEILSKVQAERERDEARTLLTKIRLEEGRQLGYEICQELERLLDMDPVKMITRLATDKKE